MLILGIETSCDETAAAIVEDGTKILSNVVASSQALHTKTGGIIPEVAAREQIKSIIPVINEALITKNIDAIAITYGPGLIGSLLVGVETAKTLAYLWNKPLVPVNHLIGHIYANWIDYTPKFPLIALVVSGGHTDLVLMKSHQNIQWLGGTRDDAAGEAFDKIARILGLCYPGGPAIAAAAHAHRSLGEGGKLTLLPRPLLKENTLDFSFSGLKTAVANYVKNSKNLDVYRTSAEVQEAIVDSLIEKTILAIKKYHPSDFLLAGGVAANQRLGEKFITRIKEESLLVQFHVPSPRLCTDNAAAIAAAAFFNYRVIGWQNLSANPELTVI